MSVMYASILFEYSRVATQTVYMLVHAHRISIVTCSTSCFTSVFMSLCADLEPVSLFLV